MVRHLQRHLFGKAGAARSVDRALHLGYITLKLFMCHLFIVVEIDFAGLSTYTSQFVWVNLNAELLESTHHR